MERKRELNIDRYVFRYYNKIISQTGEHLVLFGKYRLNRLISRNPILIIVLLFYSIVFIVFRAKTDNIANLMAVSGDGNLIINRTLFNEGQPFKIKDYHSWGPVLFLAGEEALKLMNNFDHRQISDVYKLWQYYQIIQFLFGCISIIFMYLILSQLSDSKLIHFLLMLNFIFVSTFIQYTFDLHPELLMLGFETIGLYFSILFFKKYSQQEENINNYSWTAFFLCLIFFALAYFSKRFPIVLIPAVIVSYFIIALLKKSPKDILKIQFLMLTSFSLIFIAIITLLVQDYNKKYSFSSFTLLNINGLTKDFSNIITDYIYPAIFDYLHPLHLGFFTTILIAFSFFIILPMKINNELISAIKSYENITLVIMLYFLVGISIFLGLRMTADIRYLISSVPLQISLAAVVLSGMSKNHGKSAPILYKSAISLLILSISIQAYSSFIYNIPTLCPALVPSNRAVLLCNDVLKKRNYSVI